MVYFIGCLHLGHESMAKYRGFSDSWEHDEWLIKCWNSVVRKKDLVYILGDITMETPEHYYKLDLLHGRKKVVLGNHDRGRDVPELLNYVEEVNGMVDYKGCALTHAPIHPNETSFYRLNIHAHIHHMNKLEDMYILDKYGQDDDRSRYFTLNKYRNVDAHLIEYKPKPLEQLINNEK